MTSLHLSSVCLTYHHRQCAGDAAAGPAGSWLFDVSARTGAGRPDDEVTIGHGEILIVDLFAADPFVFLEHHAAGARRIRDVLFDPDTRELDEAFSANLEMVGDRLVVLNELSFEPRWRQPGLLPLALELLIRKMSSCSVAVVYAPEDCHPGEDEVANLAELLSDGPEFRPFKDGVYFLDPVAQGAGPRPGQSIHWPAPDFRDRSVA